MSTKPTNEELPLLRAALTRIDGWLARHRPRYFAGLRPGAAAAELAGLPEPLQILLAWHDGQSSDFVGCFVEHWFLMSAAEIRAAQVGTPGWWPFLDDDAGNYLCLDATQAPCPVRYFDLDAPAEDAVAPSLTRWIEAFAADLEGGGYVEDPERGLMLRKPSS